MILEIDFAVFVPDQWAAVTKFFKSKYCPLHDWQLAGKVSRATNIWAAVQSDWVTDCDLTYWCQDPAGQLSGDWDVGDPGLGEQDVEEEEGQEEGADQAPAQPPVQAQLGLQHEVQVTDWEGGNVPFRENICVQNVKIFWRVKIFRERYTAPSYEAGAVNPIESNDLTGCESQYEDCPSVIVHHLQHNLSPRSDIEQAQAVADHTAACQDIFLQQNCHLQPPPHFEIFLSKVRF